MTPFGDIKTCRFLCRSGRGEAAGTRCLSEAVAPCPLSVPNHVASGVCSVSGGSKGCVRQRRPRGAVGQGQAPPGRSGRRRPGSQPGLEARGAVRWPGPARCSWGSPSRHRGAERETAFPALGGSHQSNGRAGGPGPLAHAALPAFSWHCPWGPAACIAGSPAAARRGAGAGARSLRRDVRSGAVTPRRFSLQSCIKIQNTKV